MKNIQYYTIPPSYTTIIIKGNSDASNNYFPLQDIAALQYFVADKFCLIVVLPDTSTLTSNATRQLPLSSTLRSTSKKTAVFENLQHSMISLDQLYDDNFQVIPDKNNICDFKNEK